MYLTVTQQVYKESTFLTLPSHGLFMAVELNEVTSILTKCYHIIFEQEVYFEGKFQHDKKSKQTDKMTLHTYYRVFSVL